MILLLLLTIVRTYWSVAIADMPANKHTHVQVTGTVKLAKTEQDGDTHIRLEDGKGNFIVAECIPKLPCQHVIVGDNVTVRGISRFDGEHNWYEVHPVEELQKNPKVSVHVR